MHVSRSFKFHYDSINSIESFEYGEEDSTFKFIMILSIHKLHIKFTITNGII